MTIDAYNSRTYLAGKHTWEPVTLNLREDANNNVKKSLVSSYNVSLTSLNSQAQYQAVATSSKLELKY